MGAYVRAAPIPWLGDQKGDSASDELRGEQELITYMPECLRFREESMGCLGIGELSMTRAQSAWWE